MKKVSIWLLIGIFFLHLHENSIVFASQLITLPNVIRLPETTDDFEKEYLDYYINNIAGREAIFQEKIGYNSDCNLDDGGELFGQFGKIIEDFGQGIVTDFTKSEKKNKITFFVELTYLIRKYQREYEESKKDDVILDYISDKTVEEIITKRIKSERIKKGTEQTLKLILKEFIKPYFLAVSKNNYKEISIEEGVTLLINSLKKVQTKSFSEGGVESLLLVVDVLKILADTIGHDTPGLSSLRSAAIDLVKLNISCADNYVKRIKDTDNSTEIKKQINHHFIYKMSLLYLLNAKYNLPIGYSTYDEKGLYTKRNEYIDQEFKRHLELCIDNVTYGSLFSRDIFYFKSFDSYQIESKKQCGISASSFNIDRKDFTNIQLMNIANNVIDEYRTFTKNQSQEKFNIQLDFDIQKEFALYYMTSRYGGLENVRSLKFKIDALSVNKPQGKEYKTIKEKIEENKNSVNFIPKKQEIGFLQSLKNTFDGFIGGIKSAYEKTIHFVFHFDESKNTKKIEPISIGKYEVPNGKEYEFIAIGTGVHFKKSDGSMSNSYTSTGKIQDYLNEQNPLITSDYIDLLGKKYQISNYKGVTVNDENGKKIDKIFMNDQEARIYLDSLNPPVCDVIIKKLINDFELSDIGKNSENRKYIGKYRIINFKTLGKCNGGKLYLDGENLESIPGISGEKYGYIDFITFIGGFGGHNDEENPIVSNTKININNKNGFIGDINIDKYKDLTSDIRLSIGDISFIYKGKTSDNDKIINDFKLIGRTLNISVEVPKFSWSNIDKKKIIFLSSNTFSSYSNTDLIQKFGSNSRNGIILHDNSTQKVIHSTIFDGCEQWGKECDYQSYNSSSNSIVMSIRTMNQEDGSYSPYQTYLINADNGKATPKK